MSMTVDPIYLLLGLALLWFPRSWMRRGVALARRRRRSAESERIVDPWREREPGDPAVSFRTEFGKVRNYLDLLRGVAGSLAIWGGAGVLPALAAAPGAGRAAAWQVLGVKAGIVLAGLLIQTLRYENRRVTFYPPIFYLAGLSVALCGYKAAAFAFVMIWTVNSGLRNAQAFLFAYSILLYVFGALFTSFRNPAVMVGAGLAFLPVLLSLLAARPLVIYSRRGGRGG